ncbi:hypothetical protein [Corynebacterium sp. HMSC04H06]|uniref:hypothetical protein n=1 Tax=Corynebacterium sp. HMSC04H06 TaxID=1581050 RepID=UPI00114D2C35|nr:hypothetical protein [Corynebacterium sp. HMSC04H06]
MLLKGDAVDAEEQPSQALTSRFKLGEFEGTEHSVYVDTPDRFYDPRGWSIRSRHKEGEDSYDVTFKRRAELTDNSVSKDSVDRALEEARDAGFDSSDDNYAAQVNASYASTTLDFNNKKEAGCIDKQSNLPKGDRTVDIAAELEPGKLSKATGTSIAEVGPVASATVEHRDTFTTAEVITAS